MSKTIRKISISGYRPMVCSDKTHTNLWVQLISSTCSVVHKIPGFWLWLANLGMFALFLIKHNDSLNWIQLDFSLMFFMLNGG